MTASESSARIAGLGTLFKIGSLAAAAYILMKRYKRKKPDDWINQVGYNQQTCGRSYAEGSRGYRIEIESSDELESKASEDASDRYKKMPISSIVNVMKSDELELSNSPVKPKVSDSPATGKENPYPKDMAPPRESSADSKGTEKMQVQSEVLSQGALSGRNWPRHLEGFDKGSDEHAGKLAEINAIGCMAAKGDQEAIDNLFKHVQDQDFFVRYEAIRGLLLYGGKDERELLQDMLPAGDWYLMDIRLEDMRKVC